MVTNADEVSRTIPRRGGARDVARLPVLLLAGGGASLASMQAARVVLVGDGIDIGRRLPVAPVATVVPMAPDTRPTLVLPDKSVSSLHARIVKVTDPVERTDSFEIHDLESTNGTFVDGRQISGAAPLRSGALIFLGSQVLVFRLITPAEHAAIEEDVARPFAPVATLSPAMAVVCARLRRLAPSGSEIFLLGETGVGKEVFARAIHRDSGRTGQLVAINCAAIPRELVESELFGYEKGAHSTAQGRKTGFIEAAQGGTLFLDELGEMPLELQSKLLRFLQDRKFTALGSTRVQEADVRIIAASSRTAVGARGAGGTVQAALLGRLGAQPIQLPPLRDRIEDLGRLAAHFLRNAGDRGFETEAFHALFLHDWPHNVRELEKVIAEAQLLSDGSPTIAFDHLPDSITALVEPTGDLPANPDGAVRELLDPAVKTARTRRPAPTAEELTALLGQYQGNVAHVARHLKRQYAVVWRCIQRYGIDANQFRPPASGPGAGEPANQPMFQQGGGEGEDQDEDPDPDPNEDDPNENDR
jgi:DNA-binding NtrC family response regulator